MKTTVKTLYAGLILFSALTLTIAAMGRQSVPANIIEEPVIAEQAEVLAPLVQSRAEQVARALVAAYPDYVLSAELRTIESTGSADWAVLVGDTWFYYADGKLLPEELLHRAPEYDPIFFYSHPRGLSRSTPPELISRRRETGGMGTTRRHARSPHFFNALYRAHNRNEASRQIRTIRFLGKNINVHYMIVEKLTLIEERIMEAAKTDTQVQAYLNNIETIAGWSWREVSGSQTRSFHSYGVAIDILPRELGGRQIYWQWAGPNWRSIPHERRYNPPDAVIRAFESFGFFWGGYWLPFDTIHFEYRPEVFILNGMEITALP
jgi:hypothetical protein